MLAYIAMVNFIKKVKKETSHKLMKIVNPNLAAYFLTCLVAVVVLVLQVQ
jgi:hypothetical protein